MADAVMRVKFTFGITLASTTVMMRLMSPFCSDLSALMVSSTSLLRRSIMALGASSPDCAQDVPDSASAASTPAPSRAS